MKAVLAGGSAQVGRAEKFGSCLNGTKLGGGRDDFACQPRT